MEMIRVTKPQGRLLLDPLAPESDSKFEIFNQIERLRDPSHTFSLRLTTFLSMFEEHGLEFAAVSARSDNVCATPSGNNIFLQLLPILLHLSTMRFFDAQVGT